MLRIEVLFALNDHAHELYRLIAERRVTEKSLMQKIEAQIEKLGL